MEFRKRPDDACAASAPPQPVALHMRETPAPFAYVRPCQAWVDNVQNIIAEALIVAVNVMVFLIHYLPANA